jgi:hypothetical protein
MNIRGIARSRLLPAGLLVVGFGLGCTVPISSFAIRNDSSQALTVQGQHDGDARARVELVLPPGGSAQLKVSESGKFTGSVQAATQRWSTGQRTQCQSRGEVLTFIDDPQQPGQLRMMQLFPPVQPRPLSRRESIQPADRECAIINETTRDVVVINLARPTDPGVLLPAMHFAYLPFSLNGTIRHAVVRDQQTSEIVLPSESDRIWTIR